jgi:hypothetical protein
MSQIFLKQSQISPFLSVPTFSWVPTNSYLSQMISRYRKDFWILFTCLIILKYIFCCLILPTKNLSEECISWYSDKVLGIWIHSLIGILLPITINNTVSIICLVPLLCQHQPSVIPEAYCSPRWHSFPFPLNLSKFYPSFKSHIFVLLSDELNAKIIESVWAGPMNMMGQSLPMYNDTTLCARSWDSLSCDHVVLVKLP